VGATQRFLFTGGILTDFRLLMQGRTTMVVAHRSAATVRADEILVVRDRHVCARGTQRRVLAKQGLYKRLYRLQRSVARDALGAPA
jgi:ABC-type multidrug transport system fused ATPase/permease subunit